MSIALAVVLFATGLLLTVKGSDVFVDSATRIATKARVPKFIIGATLVSVATTLPEIFVSVIASIQQKPDMAFGTSVGSVTANFCVMIAISFIYMPAVGEPDGYVDNYWDYHYSPDDSYVVFPDDDLVEIKNHNLIKEYKKNSKRRRHSC